MRSRAVFRSVVFRLTIAAAIGSLGSSIAGAQTVAQIHLSGERTVEVIGLKRWTIQMIQDSLGKYSPGDSLQSHACAAVLRGKLHFADASVTEYRLGNKPIQFVVTVREPQDSARVHLRVMPSDTVGGRREWVAVSEVARNRPDILFPAMQTFLGTISGKARPHVYASHADSVTADRFVSFLRVHRSSVDQRTALRSLAADSNVYDRMTAALILANFPDSDSSWWALVEGLREDGPVVSVASNVLNALIATPRLVDWHPKAEAIRVMLDGSGLFGLPPLIRTLNATNVGAEYARAFLRGGGEILAAYLGSSNVMLSEPSRALLTKLRGIDLGPQPGPWRDWIQSL